MLTFRTVIVYLIASVLFSCTQDTSSNLDQRREKPISNPVTPEVTFFQNATYSPGSNGAFSEFCFGMNNRSKTYIVWHKVSNLDCRSSIRHSEPKEIKERQIDTALADTQGRVINRFSDEERDLMMRSPGPKKTAVTWYRPEE